MTCEFSQSTFFWEWSVHSSSVENSLPPSFPKPAPPFENRDPSKMHWKSTYYMKKWFLLVALFFVASQLSKQEFLLSVQFCFSKSDLNLFCRCQVFVVCMEAFSISDYNCEYCSHGPQTWHFSLFSKSEQHLKMKPLINWISAKVAGDCCLGSKQHFLSHLTAGWGGKREREDPRVQNRKPMLLLKTCFSS